MTKDRSAGNGSGHHGADERAPVAVLLCGYGEVEHNEELEDYNALGVRLLVSKSLRVPERLVPLLARRQARRATKEYEAADFTSPHNRIFEEQRAGIEAALRTQLPGDIRAFKAFNFIDADVPERVLPQIRAAGYDRIALVPLLVVDSVYTGGLALEQVNKALATPGLSSWLPEMRYLPSFFDRPDFHRLVADQIRAAVAPLRERMTTSQIGLVLLNHGCPYKAKGFDTGIRESRLLFHAVRDQLIGEFPSLSIGWMNHPTPGRWTQPDMLQAAKNLLTTGARVIVFAPIGFVTDNHETMLDVGYVIKKLGPDVETMQLPSLNADPAFTKAAAGWIAPLVEELQGLPHGSGAVTGAAAGGVPAGAGA